MTFLQIIVDDDGSTSVHLYYYENTPETSHNNICVIDVFVWQRINSKMTLILFKLTKKQSVSTKRINII